MTTVPPANSTPFLSPFVQIVTTPAMMTTHDKAIACHRQRRKSKLVCLKICIKRCRSATTFALLDTQRRYLLAVRKRHLEERLGHEDGREQVRDETDAERDRKPA